MPALVRPTGDDAEPTTTLKKAAKKVGLSNQVVSERWDGPSASKVNHTLSKA